MNATEVRHFLSSESGYKSFKPMDLDDNVESIFYAGTVYSSNVAAGGNYRIKVGIGFHAYQDGTFIEMDSIQIEHGEYFGSEDTRIDIDEFVRTTKYYAFIRNEFPDNGFAYAWGSVSVFSSVLAA